MVSFSCGQPPIGQPLTNNGDDEAIQPFQGMPLHVASVEPECELINVAAYVLLADLVVNAIHATLEDRPDTLNAVCAGGATGIFSRAVIHSLMPEEKPVQITKDDAIVAVNLRTNLNVIVNPCGDILNGTFLHWRSNSPTAALSHPENSSLTDGTATRLELLVLMLIGFLAADKAFVDFDDALELGQVRPTAGFAESMKDKPSRLLSNTDFLGQLQRRDTLPGRDKQIHSVEPFMKRNMRPLEDGASADREVQLAGIATIESTLPSGDSLLALAGRAGNAILPEPGFEIQPGGFRVGVHLKQLKRAYCAFAHGLNILYSRTLVKGIKYIIPFHFPSLSSRRPNLHICRLNSGIITLVS